MKQEHQVESSETQQNWASVQDLLRSEISHHWEPVEQQWGVGQVGAEAKGSVDWNRWLGVVALFALFGIAMFCLIPGPLHGPRSVVPMCAILGLWAALQVSLKPKFKYRALSEDLDIVANSVRTDELLVAMSVVVDGIDQGVDRGVLWAESGSLCFFGHRSWFRVRLQDAILGSLEPCAEIRSEFAGFEPEVTVVVHEPGKLVRIGIRELDSPGAEERSLVPMIVSFFSSKLVGAGETQLPPLERDAQYRSRFLQNLSLECCRYLAVAIGLWSVLQSNIVWPESTPWIEPLEAIVCRIVLVGLMAAMFISGGPLRPLALRWKSRRRI